jgi:hypothetical protein
MSRPRCHDTNVRHDINVRKMSLSQYHIVQPRHTTPQPHPKPQPQPQPTTTTPTSCSFPVSKKEREGGCALVYSTQDGFSYPLLQFVMQSCGNNFQDQEWPQHPDPRPETEALMHTHLWGICSSNSSSSRTHSLAAKAVKSGEKQASGTPARAPSGVALPRSSQE